MGKRTKYWIGREFTLNCGVVVKVVGYTEVSSKIRMADSEGHEQVVDMSSLKGGSVMWKGARKAPKPRATDVLVGSWHTLNCGVKVQIVERDGSRAAIEDMYGNRKWINSVYDVRSGGVGWWEFLRPKYDENTLTFVEGKAYVYMAKCDGEVVYIGKGRGSRYRHVCSGASGVRYLNMLHFSGAQVSVEIVKDGMTDSDAHKLEKELILKHLPKGNVAHSPAYGEAWNDMKFRIQHKLENGGFTPEISASFLH